MSVIKDSKKGTLESTTKVIASSAEKEYINKKALGLEVGTIKYSDVVKMSRMFIPSAATSLDVSGFDISSVTDMQAMFSGSKATTGYARTQEDADRFNASTTSRPSGLTFVVK